MTILSKFWPWPSKKSAPSTPPSVPSKQPGQSEDIHSFYQRAIEWTHRADKVINLVLGYLLAIASVLGFMDVLSNGEVLGAVPYAFYVWLAIMGLGVDFQILLVIGRIPDLARTVENGWFRFVFFVFNIAFLAFLCYMSIIIAAVFTQHRDVPGTIAQAMSALGIDGTRFVFERAALATLLLVLMAVDRTMERWRMQVALGEPVHQQATAPAPAITGETAPAATLTDETVQLILKKLAKLDELEKALLTTITPVQEPSTLALPEPSMPRGVDLPGDVNEDREPHTDLPSKQKEGLPSEQSYGDRIEALYKDNPQITATEVEKKLGCSRTTAASWLRKLRPVM